MTANRIALSDSLDLAVNLDVNTPQLSALRAASHDDLLQHALNLAIVVILNTDPEDGVDRTARIREAMNLPERQVTT